LQLLIPGHLNFFFWKRSTWCDGNSRKFSFASNSIGRTDLMVQASDLVDCSDTPRAAKINRLILTEIAGCDMTDRNEFD